MNRPCEASRNSLTSPDTLCPIIFFHFPPFIKPGLKTALTIGAGGCFPPYEDCPLCKTHIK